MKIINMENRVLFIKICYYIGVFADLEATIPLIFPEVIKYVSGDSAESRYTLIVRKRLTALNF